jgi:hypothetical protein
LKSTSAQKKEKPNMTFPSTILSFGDDPGSGSGGSKRPQAKKKPAKKKAAKKR